jgi:hypothetical protein
VRTHLTSGLLVAVAITLGGCGRGPSVAADPAATDPPQATRTPEQTAAAEAPTSPQVLDPMSDDELVRVAQTFVRFAEGELRGPPSMTPVEVYVGGIRARTIEAPDQEDRSQWGGLCPQPGGYAGWSCPFSIIEPLRHGAGTTYVVGHAEHPCAHPSPIEPAEVGATHVVSAVPRTRGDCTSWASVELFVNDVAQVVAVNLVLAEP